MDMKELEMFCSISISYGIFKKNIPLGKKEGFFLSIANRMVVI